MESNKPLLCNFPLCTVTVGSYTELEKHLSSHMDKSGLFSCPALGCDYATSTKRGLLIHWCKHTRRAAATGSPEKSRRPRKGTSTPHPGNHHATRPTFSARTRSSRKSGSSNNTSNDTNGIGSGTDSDSASSASHHSSGIPWQGRIWPHDFLEIMENSAALRNTTGGCYYLDTPDGRKNVPAHMLLPELYENCVGIDDRWIIMPEEEEEWTLESESRRLERNVSPMFPEFDTVFHTTGREGCLCGEWMVESGCWNQEDLPPPIVFTTDEY
ncbi:hypothetical protein V8B97DRAFT_1930336 [Scleroderma yunnanense]